MTNSTEHTSLLAYEDQHDEDSRKGTKTRIRRSETFVVTILMVIILLLGTGDELIQPAQTRVIESIYCRQYFQQHDPSLIGSDGRDGVAEQYCKNHVVQGQVAMLKGWLTTIDAFVMLLVSVPWGYAADVYGRKPIVLLICCSMWFRAAWIEVVCWFWNVFNIKMVWLAAGASLFGGGAAVANALVFTILADVVPEVRRVSTFFRVGASSTTTMVIGPAMSAFLMKRSPWIPMLLGLALQSLCVLLVLPLPETKDHNVLHNTPEPSESNSSASSENSIKASPLTRLVQAGKDSITFLASDKRLMLLIPAFLMHMLLMNRDILLQYTSTRYNITLANATYLLTFRAIWILALLLLLFPVLSTLLRTTYSMHPDRADLYLGRASAIVMALGFLLIAVAPSIPLLVCAMAINTLGVGIHLYLRSLATSLVEPHHVARLNTFVSWFDMVGLMVGSPLLAWLFERGIDMGTEWMGLPFLFNAGVIAAIAVLLTFIRIGRPEMGPEEGVTEGLDGYRDEEER